jgi:predicted nucleotidyltransferase
MSVTNLLAPPTEHAVRKALARFAGDVTRHYGRRLKGIYLFGSRARGDHRPDSDADVAIVLEDGNWTPWEERWTLVRLAYAPSLDSGLGIQPWPFSATQWDSVDLAQTTKLVSVARSEAVPIGPRE